MKFFKNMFFMEADPLIKKGKTRVIVESDMLALPEHLNPRGKVFPEEEIDWSSPGKHLYSILKAARSKLVPAYTWYFVSALFSLSTPLLVNRFVTLIGTGVTAFNLKESLFTGVLLGFCGFMTGFCLQHYFLHALAAFQIATNILNKKIFSHSLKLTLQSKGRNPVGDVVNHMSSDSDAVADFTFVFGDLASNTFLILGVIVMLFYFMGITAIAALIAFFSLAPLTRYVATKFTKLEEEMMAFRDKRVTLMTQTLNAIRVVKYFGWEKSVEKEVMEIRDKELVSRKKLARSEVLSGLGYMAISTVVLFIALATHALRGQKIDAALIFTCVSLFGLIEGPFGDLSHLISRFTNGYVGAGRILKYLSQESLDDEMLAFDDSKNPVGVELNNVTAYFEDREKSILKNINLTIEPGEAIAIVGAVGSAKSALLYAILREMKFSHGSIHFSGGKKPSISYLPQEAYIINSTLLENILFGESASDKEIDHALFLSCLERDLETFKGGLKTEIGEKGVNLSGGQKQRVGLARAVLYDPQLILLDDPLSAVDVDTEKLLCERLLFGEWKNKTRIIVTHRLSHLYLFDKVLFMDDGEVGAIGTFEEVLLTSNKFKAFYAEHNKSHAKNEEEMLISEHAKISSTLGDDKGRITEDEDREVGAVEKTIYLDYLKSLGGVNPKTAPWILTLLVLGALVVAITPLIQKSWLSYYSTHQMEWTAINAIGVYGIIGIGVLLVGLLNNFFWLDRGIKAGKTMHDKMLQSVLKAPVRFFDSTPVGRIIQRFSRDIESVDVYLQWSFIAVVNCVLQVIVSVGLILTLVPLMAIVIVPVLYAYYIVQKNYRSPAREAKRFDSISRSPRYSHFKETLQGLIVIRSYSKESWFTENFFNKLAESQRMFYSHYMLNRWFSSRIPLVGGVISMATAVGITLSAYYGLMTAGTAGLITIYSLSFWSYLNWGVRMFADIESRMTSIERLKFFANIPPEKSVMKISSGEIHDTWPSKGALVAKNLKVRYADHLPQVLKGVNFNVHAGTKVGIMGRTGSGKSTLFQTLFRFIELEDGHILIDGIDIATVPIERLRKSMAIIPQDPTLFMGTIRNNLDRYNEYEDEKVIAVLKHAGLMPYIEALPKGIHSEVVEGGQNFSQGQKQLLCLARALLINAKIIIMDEATASVDVQTDALLQKVIREELNGVTMLIIAHRLGTVSDCDQIIEIVGGESKIIKNEARVH
ncbi:MAG: ABC transporter transmembrane domain-containing protein [Bacteriovorax sp.]|jgi:ABC-type multidrug transport system fused ATPase/permease subunit